MRVDISEYKKPVDAPLTEVELNVVNVLLDEKEGIQPGKFYKAMIAAILAADETHKWMLHEQLPELVDAVNAYQLGNLEERWEHQYGSHDDVIDNPSGGE
jgi:hypothetical protein